MTPPDQPQHVVSDGDVGFVDAADGGLDDVVAAMLPLVEELPPGAVISVHIQRVDVVAELLAWCDAADAPVEAVASFDQYPGTVVTLRCR